MVASNITSTPFPTSLQPEQIQQVYTAADRSREGKPFTTWGFSREQIKLYGQIMQDFRAYDARRAELIQRNQPQVQIETVAPQKLASPIQQSTQSAQQQYKLPQNIQTTQVPQAVQQRGTAQVTSTPIPMSAFYPTQAPEPTATPVGTYKPSGPKTGAGRTTELYINAKEQEKPNVVDVGAIAAGGVLSGVTKVLDLAGMAAVAGYKAAEKYLPTPKKNITDVQNPKSYNILLAEEQTKMGENLALDVYVQKEYDKTVEKVQKEVNDYASTFPTTVTTQAQADNINAQIKKYAEDVAKREETALNKRIEDKTSETNLAREQRASTLPEQIFKADQPFAYSSKQFGAKILPEWKYSPEKYAEKIETSDKWYYPKTELGKQSLVNVTSFTYGAYEGVREKPYQTAITTGIAFALPVVGKVGSTSLGLISTETAGAAATAAVASKVSYLGTAAKVGVGAIYIGSVGARVYTAPAERKYMTLGSIASTEILPGFAGAYAGSKLGNYLTQPFELERVNFKPQIVKKDVIERVFGYSVGKSQLGVLELPSYSVRTTKVAQAWNWISRGTVGKPEVVQMGNPKLFLIGPAQGAEGYIVSETQKNMWGRNVNVVMNKPVFTVERITKTGAKPYTKYYTIRGAQEIISKPEWEMLPASEKKLWRMVVSPERSSVVGDKTIFVKEDIAAQYMGKMSVSSSPAKIDKAYGLLGNNPNDVSKLFKRPVMTLDVPKLGKTLSRVQTRVQAVPFVESEQYTGYNFIIRGQTANIVPGRNIYTIKGSSVVGKTPWEYKTEFGTDLGTLGIDNPSELQLEALRRANLAASSFLKTPSTSTPWSWIDTTTPQPISTPTSASIKVITKSTAGGPPTIPVGATTSSSYASSGITPVSFESFGPLASRLIPLIPKPTVTPIPHVTTDVGLLIGSSSSSLVFSNPKEIAKFPTRESNITMSVQAPDVMQTPQVINLPSEKQVPNLINLPSQIQVPQQVQTPTQVQVPVQVQVPTAVTKVLAITTTPPLISSTTLYPPIPPILSPSENKRGGKKKLVPAYITQIRRKNKFITVGGPTTKAVALSIGQKEAKRTLAATFRVVPVSARVIQQPFIGGGFKLDVKRFRAPKNKAPLTFVQRKGITEGAPLGSGGRLASYGERIEIMRTRKAKPKLGMKIKGFLRRNK